MRSAVGTRRPWYPFHVSGGREVRALTPILVRMLEGRVGSTAMMQLLATSSSVALDRVYPFQNSYLTYFAPATGQISRPCPGRAGILEFVYQSDPCVEPLPFEAGIIDPLDMAQRSLSAIWLEFSRTITAAFGRRGAVLRREILGKH